MWVVTAVESLLSRPEQWEKLNDLFLFPLVCPLFFLQLSDVLIAMESQRRKTSNLSHNQWESPQSTLLLSSFQVLLFDVSKLSGDRANLPSLRTRQLDEYTKKFIEESQLHRDEIAGLCNKLEWHERVERERRRRTRTRMTEWWTTFPFYSTCLGRSSRELTSTAASRSRTTTERTVKPKQSDYLGFVAACLKSITFHLIL